MNYLAHMFLARQNGDTMLGGMLGDFVTPNEGRRFPWEIAREIELHRYIDSFTDQHPIVLAAKRRFRPHTRRFAGLLLDLFFDHALITDWERYSQQSLATFIKTFQAAALTRRRMLPDTFNEVAARMIEQGWLTSYATVDGVAQAVRGVSSRLSRGAERMRAGVDDLREHQAALHADFAQFFPTLLAFAERRRAELDEAALSESATPSWVQPN